MAEAKRDANQVTTLLGVSNADGTTPVTVYADPTTHRLLVSESSSAAGSDTQVQFNDGGSFGGDAGFTYNKTTDAVTIAGSLSTPSIITASGALTVTPAAGSNINFALSTTGDFAVNTDDLYVDTSAGFVGLSTTAPTHTLTLPSTATGIALYNTADQVTNYERAVISWVSNVFTIASGKAGSGTARSVQILSQDGSGMTFANFATISLVGSSAGMASINTASNDVGIAFTSRHRATVGATGFSFINTPGSGNSFSATSGTQTLMSISTTVNQTTTAAYNGLLVNITEATTGSGAHNLFVLQTGGTTVCKVDSAGLMTITGAIVPTTTDGAALGSSSLQWSDLFLAEGAVINWDNGDATLTQTGNVLAVAGADLQVATAGVGTNADSVPTLSSTSTLTNKRITKRTGTVASSATPTINTDNVDFYSITALAAAITSFTTNLSGTPTEAQTLWIAITDDGTARGITWGASFEASGNVALPTTTVISTRLDVGFIWNTVTTKWRCVAVA